MSLAEMLPVATYTTARQQKKKKESRDTDQAICVFLFLGCNVGDFPWPSCLPVRECNRRGKGKKKKGKMASLLCVQKSLMGIKTRMLEKLREFFTTLADLKRIMQDLKNIGSFEAWMNSAGQ